MFPVITRLAVFLSVLAVGIVSAVPVHEPNHAPLATRAVPAAPHFVAYSDLFVAMPSSPEIAGYNVFVLSFLLTTGAADMAAAWERLSPDQRSSILNDYHRAGISLMVSAFGETNAPTTLGADAVQTANTMAQWVKAFGVDGIDVDYEDFAAIDAGTAGPWVESFVRTLRQQLPAGQFIITGAPIAPWFTTWYVAVDRAVGSMIDWYNIQYYAQGSAYTTCDTLIHSSGGQFPGSSLLEIANAGFPLNKLIVGKPGSPADATGGYIPPEVLAGCIADAKNRGWNGGVSVWQWPHAPSSWIRTVRGQAFPLVGGKNKTTSSSFPSPSSVEKNTTSSSFPPVSSVGKKPKATSTA